MLYPNLKFSKSPKARPFFYTNFVSTVDGKVTAPTPDYWPIGSKTDYKTLLELRSYADCLIHGAVLAKKHGELTLKSLNKADFKKMRKAKGKSEDLPYIVMTKDPKQLSALKDKAVLFEGSINLLVKELKNKGYKHILVEGGPTLLGSFIKEELIDEIFLTIAPKIYGSRPNSTKTLIEGILLPPNKFKLKLSSFQRVKDELYLRYQVRS